MQSAGYFKFHHWTCDDLLLMLQCPLSGCHHMQGNLMIIEEVSGAKEPLFVYDWTRKPDVPSPC